MGRTLICQLQNCICFPDTALGTHFHIRRLSSRHVPPTWTSNNGKTEPQRERACQHTVRQLDWCVSSDFGFLKRDFSYSVRYVEVSYGAGYFRSGRCLKPAFLLMLGPPSTTLVLLGRTHCVCTPCVIYLVLRSHRIYSKSVCHY